MTWFRTHRFELLLGLAFALLLAPLLLPGYVLTLDMVFAPTLPAPQVVAGAYRNGWVLRSVLHGLSFVIPGWIVQKLVFIALFGTMATAAYRWLLPKADVSTKALLAVFYVFSPFVYTRFLAGQWTILFAYALLPLVFWAADFRAPEERPHWKQGLWLGLALAGVFAGSLHLGVMAFVLVAAQVVATASGVRRTGFALLVAAGAFLLATSYWTIPALVQAVPSVIESFDGRHLDAFATTVHPQLGPVGTVLALAGFWGEREPWAEAFVWAEDLPWVWAIAGVVLAAGLLWGVAQGLRMRALRRQTLALLFLAVLALVASLGMAESPVQGLNRWAFEHLPFWSGFRDSQKWSALLVLVYAWLLGLASERLPRAGRVVLLVAVFAFTYPMLGGFSGQLRPTWYPAEWVQANAILSQEPNCKAVFLPWHMYYKPSWNHDRLVASPASAYFNCEMIVSRNVELGSIRTQGAIDPAYDALDSAIVGRDALTPEQVLEALRAAGVTHVLSTSDIPEPFPIYAVLEGAEKLFTGERLTLYRLVE